MNKMFEMHHAYFGAIIMAFGFYYNIWLIVFGFWIMMDDVGQHIMINNYDKNYVSFLHWAGRPFYRLISKYKWLSWLKQF